MTKRHKWLSRAAVLTGVLITLVLILAINSEPLVHWFQVDSPQTVQERDVEPGRSGLTAWQRALGTALISVAILTLLLIHLALLIGVAASLNRPHTPAAKTPAVCPQCKHSIQLDWRICPYCGFKLGKDLDRSPAGADSSPTV